jgi:polyphosphate kinase 2 (PPK2 family)
MSKISKTDGNGKLKNKEYMNELRKLQEKLCMLQEWVKAKGLRVMIVFEGRDAAGNGGTTRALTERVSPRVFRVVALPAPSDRERGNYTCSAIWRIFRPRARSWCLTGVGTTALASSTC